MVLDIHGLVIECESSHTELIQSVIRPFTFFVVQSGQPELKIDIRQTEPPYNDLPQMKACFSTPRNIVFKQGDLKVIDYFGKGIVIEEKNQKKFSIYGRDKDFLQESFYLLVLSLFSQYCDDKGFLRIHALVFSMKDTAFIFSAQSGGGKSTMALGLMENDDFKLISDDEAILTAAGDLLSLPLRIGTLDKDKLNAIPDEYIYEIDRMEFGKKYFIDIDYWSDKLEKRKLNKKVFLIAKRLMNGAPYIEKASRYDALTNLLGSAVIGLGLYQGMEFVFNNSPWELFKRFPVFLKRLMAALKFALTTDSYQIYLCRDSTENIRILTNFVTDTYRST